MNFAFDAQTRQQRRQRVGAALAAQGHLESGTVPDPEIPHSRSENVIELPRTVADEEAVAFRGFITRLAGRLARAAAEDAPAGIEPWKDRHCRRFLWAVRQDDLRLQPSTICLRVSRYRDWSGRRRSRPGLGRAQQQDEQQHAAADVGAIPMHRSTVHGLASGLTSTSSTNSHALAPAAGFPAGICPTFFAWMRT